MAAIACLIFRSIFAVTEKCAPLSRQAAIVPEATAPRAVPARGAQSSASVGVPHTSRLPPGKTAKTSVLRNPRRPDSFVSTGGRDRVEDNIMNLGAIIRIFM